MKSGEDMKSSKKQDILKDLKGRQIPICSWLPTRSICQLVVVHGFSEHMIYYQAMAQWLSQNGVAVHMMDLPGHGMSGGMRGHIDDFREYLDNVDLLIQSNPYCLRTKPTFLLGHSLGGLIAVHYCLRKKNNLKGLLLSSPLSGFPAPSSWIHLALVRFLSREHLNEPFPKPAGVKSLSRNPDQWKVYQSDPCRGRLITPKLYLAMAQKTEELQLAAPALTLPLLAFISAKDSVVCPDATQQFFKAVGSKDKSLVVFAEAMHELFQEEESEQLLQKSLSWMKARI